MSTRPVAHKRTHLKHPKSASANTEQRWLRHFWSFFAGLALISIALIAYNKFDPAKDTDEDAYVSVQTRTVAGNSNNVICKLSLLIDQEQEKRINSRQKQLEAVVNSVLTEAYQGSERPPLAEVRQQLYVALNNKLPRKLQIRDVYIQELIIGNT